jgi:hypothetical protein
MASNWRSPSDLSKRGGSQPVEKRQEGGHTINLEDQAEHWMAPVADDTGARTKLDGQGGMALSMQVATWNPQNWPAPTVRDHKGSSEGSITRQDGGHTINLEDQAEHWMAPVADDTGARTKLDGQGGMALSMQVATWNPQNWPAPTVRDHKGSSEGSITRQDGKSRADMLDFAAEQFFHPPSFPAPPIAAGAMSSTDSPNTNQPSVKRKLNPIFVEALMRWPTGLSGFARPATAWIQWQQLMPSYLSALASGFGPEPEQADLFG